MRKPVFLGFPTRSDINWPVQPQKQARGFKFLVISRRGIVLSVEAVNAQLICVFIFAKAKICFSHYAAQIFEV